MNTQFNRINLGTTTFNYLKYGARVEISPDPFENFVMLEIPVTGCSQVYYGDEQVASERDRAVVVSPSLNARSRWNYDTSRLMVQVDSATLEKLLSQVLGYEVKKRIEFSLELKTSTYLGKGLRDYIFYVVNQLSENSYLQQNELVRAEMERNIMLMLLCAQKNNYSEHINANAVPGHPKYIRRANEYIKDNYNSKIGVEDLLVISGVSARTLYAGFRRYFGMTPMMALKRQRLKGVRDVLLDGRKNQSITRVATAHGFTHMGNFSKDYFLFYGEKPSQTYKHNC